MGQRRPTHAGAAPKMARVSRLHALEATPARSFLPDPARVLGPLLALHASIFQRLSPPRWRTRPGPLHLLDSHKRRPQAAALETVCAAGGAPLDQLTRRSRKERAALGGVSMRFAAATARAVLVRKGYSPQNKMNVVLCLRK